MTPKDYASFDGVGLAHAIKSRQISASDALDAAITIIEAHNPALNAVVYKGYDQARQQIATGKIPEGPFAGVPFLIKDLGCPVGGWPRTSGSFFIRDYVPPEDGALTKRYRAAGLVLTGKTNTPEFGITGTTEGARLGPCRNPWSPDHIAGGSSGGAAASVASGMVPMAHASDGLGSIRIPAAVCGLVGLKVTRDRNPCAPEDPDRSIGLSVDHVVTRTVRDSAAMLDATGIHDSDLPAAPLPRPADGFLAAIDRPPAPLRIAFSDATPSGTRPHPEVRAALEAVASHLQSLGHHVEERAPEMPWRRYYAAQRAVSAANFAAGITDLIEKFGREPEPHELEPLTWASLNGGRRVSGLDVMRGWRTMRVLGRQLLAFHDTYELFLTPVLITPPPPIGFIDPVNLTPKEVSDRQAATFGYTPPANFTGQPAISLPLAWSSAGLPMGFQFAGRFGDEETLLRLARQLEQSLPWAGRRPGLYG